MIPYNYRPEPLLDNAVEIAKELLTSLPGVATAVGLGTKFGLVYKLLKPEQLGLYAGFCAHGFTEYNMSNSFT